VGAHNGWRSDADMRALLARNGLVIAELDLV
jgi:hypothetical protein